jgi:hypothetical protein
MAVVVPNTSPTNLLGRFRGTIFDAAPGYPDVIIFQARDAEGGEWWFSTFYAEFSPREPKVLLGKSIIDTDLDPSGKLTISFSDGSSFIAVPIPLQPGEPDDDLENWHLFTPDDFVLNYGPEGRWEIKPCRYPGRAFARP